MKDVKWIIQNWNREISYTNLAEAATKANYPVKLITGDFKWPDYQGYIDDCVIFCGSIQTTKQARDRFPGCVPIVYSSFDKFLCSRYYSHFGAYLFNDVYSLVSLREFVRNKFFYYNTFGKEGCLFIRPDSGDKPFTAQVLDIMDVDRFLENNKDQQHELVLLSTPKNIRWEGRFLVTKENKIIAQSTYQYQGQVTKIPSVPPRSIKIVEEILQQGYYPDSVFCIDLCEDNDGNFWLLELTSFSAAGLYAMDLDKVVAGVSAQAYDDWVNS